jgi:4'-phosphopantetheinyl transferase
LTERDVIVFLARPGDLGREEALAALTAEDRAHVDRFRFERDRDVALASRALERRVLAAHAHLPDLTSNVSNTHGLVGIAIARGREVGFDLEPSRTDAPEELIDRCFSPAERAALAALPAAERPRRFVELWVLKEAYIKARRRGLELPLEEITFTFDGGEPRLALAPSLGDDAASWQLDLWAPTPGHRAALCVRRGDGPPLRIDRGG